MINDSFGGCQYGYEYCCVCAARWKECDGAQWDEARLLELGSAKLAKLLEMDTLTKKVQNKTKEISKLLLHLLPVRPS